MKSSFAWILTTVFALSPAFAEGEPEHPAPGRQLMYHGEITDVDHAARSFTLETRTGPETFTLVEGGNVLGAGVEKSFDALAVGQQVAVRAASQDETNRWLASSVQIVDPHEVAGQVEDLPAFDAADTATVTSVDEEARRLEVETVDGPRLYRVTSETRIQRGSDEIGLEALEPGERVAVSAEETSPGQFTARTVTVVAGEPDVAAPPE